eukprot:TRINITY_DN23768_c0_g1_i1.p1 TRINITY_DN23768_c0_g1~~TRINITY_DN23768_c0_g1_i1.p1  ORF type:complete len:335 (-),score=84.00 TRINITY_DN23768_c0_g1_i1:398-1360(-)
MPSRSQLPQMQKRRRCFAMTFVACAGTCSLVFGPSLPGRYKGYKGPSPDGLRVADLASARAGLVSCEALGFQKPSREDMKEAMTFEAMEAPPMDMLNLDILREKVAQHEADPRWARVDDDIMRRHHLARKLDPEKAYEALENLVQWQSETFPISESFIEPEVKTKKLLVHGKDKMGHPVVYLICKRHDRRTRDIDKCVANAVATVEQALSEMPEGVGKMLIVFDAREFGLAQVDLSMIRKAIFLLERCYPVRAYKLYAVGLPSIFNYLWKLATKWLDPLSASKVAFLQTMEELSEFIDDEELLLDPDSVKVVKPEAIAAK